MKLIKKIQEGGRLDDTILSYGKRNFTDAQIFEINLYLKVVILKFQIGVPNGKKVEIL